MPTTVIIDKKRFKYAKRRAKITNKEIGYLIGYSEDGIDKITREKASGAIDGLAFKELCKILDVHPDYLTGKSAEPMHGVLEDILSLKKKAFFKKYPDIDRSQYSQLVNSAKSSYDAEGNFIQSYTSYLSEISKDVCIDRFKKWLLAVNVDEFTALEFLSFPTNEELAKILESMRSSELWDFWNCMTHKAYEYLIDNKYYDDFYKNNPTEEEIAQRFKLKLDDQNKSRLEEI